MKLRQLVVVAAFSAGCGAAAPPVGAPNVVLVTLESLRVDHVGAYGGASPVRPDVPVTPAIDAFASAATVYPNAYAVTSWTLASHASLFTGLYPSGHQTEGPRDRLDDSYPTLAESLSDRGYQTAGVVSGPYLRRTHNLQQGFQLYDDAPASITNALAHDDVTNPRMEAALRRFVVEERDAERPFFLFAYFWDPHFDFLPPPPHDRSFRSPEVEPFDLRGFDTNPDIAAGISAGRRAFLLSQYAGEVRWTDEHVGRFFELLQERGLWDDTLVILTADHGEEFFDHGEKGHKNNLYAETTRVPLIVKYPGQSQGRRDERLVSLVDVLPTVLDASGVEVDFPLHGRSLLEPSEDAAEAVLGELLAVWYTRSPEGELDARRHRWSAVRQGDYRLLWREPDESDGAPSYELYDVARDPSETRDLAAEQPERSRSLRRAHDALVERARRDAGRYRRGGPAQLSEEERAQLRELGYLEP